jgi:hypothetical protein
MGRRHNGFQKWNGYKEAFQRAPHFAFGGFVRVKGVWEAGMSIQYLRFLLCILADTVFELLLSVSSMVCMENGRSSFKEHEQGCVAWRSGSVFCFFRAVDRETEL